MAFIGPYQQYTIDGTAPVARVQDWVKLATAINTGLATAKDGAVADAKTYTDAREAAAITASNTYTDGKGFTPAWKASTAYPAGFRVVSPNGDIVSAKIAFTSGATYNAANWNSSVQDGRLAAVETKNTDQDARLNGRTLVVGQDFHTVTEQGHHKMTGFPTNWATQNMPVNVRGELEVITMSTNRILIYRTYETVPRTFMQTLVTGVWGAWKDMEASAAAVATRATDLESSRAGKTIDPAQDFHTITADGKGKMLTFPTSWTTQNMPVGVRGVLDVTNMAANRVLTYVTYETTPRLFIQTLVAGVWGAWREIGSASVETRVTSLEAKSGFSSQASGLKVVPLQLTLGSASQADAALTGTRRYPMKWNAPIQRVRVNIQNVHPSSGTLKTGAVDFTGLWIGKHAGSGAFTTTPTQVASAFSTPADGSKWVSKWFWLNQTPGVEDLLSFGYTASAGTVFQIGGSGWKTSAPADGGTTSPSGMTADGSMPFYIWLEAETYATTPHIGVFGDSLSSGVSAGGVLNSMLSQYCWGKKALPTHYSNSGDTMQSWAGDLNSYKWKVFDGLAKPDALIWAMGSNDLFADSITLADAQASYGTLYPQMLERVSRNIYLANITPRTAVTGANETKRRDYNTWLTGLPLGARDLFNFRDAVSTDDETLMPAYDVDGVHMNAAGYAAEAATITRPITTPPVMYATV